MTQPKDLYAELWLLFDRLDYAVSTLRDSGAAYAKAYHDYRVELSNHVLALRAEGETATLAPLIARGNPKVAKLKFDENSTEAIYDANREAINATKLKIRVIENMIAREYAEAGRERL